jgi:PAS domain S-box-containing protein
MVGEKTTARVKAVLRPPTLSWPLRYASAPASALLVFALQNAVFPHPDIAPFVLFTAGVALTSWLGGRGPGLVATALSAALGNYFFIAPIDEFNFTFHELLATVLFAVSGVAISLLSGSLRTVIAEAEEKARLLSVAFSEQRKTEGSLRESEERLSLARAAARLGVYDRDLTTGKLAWDERMRELWGVAPGVPVTWELFMAVVHPEDRAAVIAAIDRGRSQGEFGIEYRVINLRDGLESWVKATGHVLFEDGYAVRQVGTVEDITERKRLEDALRDADRRKNEFLGMLSHELRNPLTPIRNSLYILERATPGGEQARRAHAVIERQVSHLARLVDDLLDVTRISRGKIRLQRARVDLVSAVRRTVEDYRVTLEDHQVAIELSDEAIWIDGDPMRLAQVIGNLLTNAAKFTPVAGKIAVSLKRAMGRAVLEVTDTGIGIDQDTLRRLFEPFTQADRSIDRSRGGLGLGLTLVKGLVELHGGRVSARSDGPGKGARFTLTFPLDEQVAVARGTRPRQSANGPGRRILVIEDNRDAADSLAEALEMADHQVTVAYDGEAGVAKAREFRPEVVLCDVGLPAGMDGFAVAQSIRGDSQTASAFLVALTGYAQPEDHRRALEAGFDVHLTKPPDLAALERLLAQAPGNRTRTDDEAAQPSKVGEWVE